MTKLLTFGSILDLKDLYISFNVNSFYELTMKFYLDNFLTPLMDFLDP